MNNHYTNGKYAASIKNNDTFYMVTVMYENRPVPGFAFKMYKTESAAHKAAQRLLAKAAA